jgi:uncharacterized protein involved in copper resistance
MSDFAKRARMLAAMSCAAALLAACAHDNTGSGSSGYGSGGSTMSSGSGTSSGTGMSGGAMQPMPGGMSGSTGATTGSGNAITGGAEGAPTDQATPQGIPPGGRSSSGSMGTGR